MRKKKSGANKERGKQRAKQIKNEEDNGRGKGIFRQLFSKKVDETV